MNHSREIVNRMDWRRAGFSLGITALAATALVAGLVALHGDAAPAGAQSASMLGVDVQPDTNRPASLGSLETCASHSVGDEFPVDIYVNNVSDLRSWELRLQYDEKILEIDSVDFAHFLVSTPPSGTIFPGLQESEAPGRDFLAAAEVQGSPDSGSGVLARLTVKALSNGTSPVEIVRTPSYFAPRLASTDTSVIWDGSIIDSKVVIGAGCGNSPVVTQKPSPAPTPRGQTPTPPSVATPGTTPVPTGGSGDPATTPPPGQVVIVPDTPGPDGPGADADNPPGAQDPDAGPGDDSNDPGAPDDPADDDDDRPGGGSLTSNNESNKSATVWPIVAGLTALILLSIGGILYTFSRRES
jgi:hypothetical protein